MGESQIGKFQEHRLQNVIFFCCVACLSHVNIPFYQENLPVDYYEDNFFLDCTVLLIITILV